MRKLLPLLAAGTLTVGCYAGVHGGVRYRGPNPVAVVATAIAVNAIINAVTTPPPPIATVELYDDGSRPGSVWVNGRYVYASNRGWVWQAGYWQTERPGYYWVQGSWQPRGNQWVWVDGYWAEPRAGYVYVDGYWDDRGNGYVWRPGTWEVERPGHVWVGGTWTVANGRRTWVRGGWQRDDGRPEWNRWRSRGRVTGGATIRDHRR